jgi:hypothetical protein
MAIAMAIAMDMGYGYSYGYGLWAMGYSYWLHGLQQAQVIYKAITTATQKCIPQFM